MARGKDKRASCGFLLQVSGAGPPSADPGGTPGNGTRPYPAPTPIDIPARTPVTYDRWLAFMDSDGRIMDTAAVRAEVFANVCIVLCAETHQAVLVVLLE